MSQVKSSAHTVVVGGNVAHARSNHYSLQKVCWIGRCDSGDQWAMATTYLGGPSASVQGYGPVIMVGRKMSRRASTLRADRFLRFPGSGLAELTFRKVVFFCTTLGAAAGSTRDPLSFHAERTTCLGGVFLHLNEDAREVHLEGRLSSLLPPDSPLIHGLALLERGPQIREPEMCQGSDVAQNFLNAV